MHEKLHLQTPLKLAHLKISASWPQQPPVALGMFTCSLQAAHSGPNQLLGQTLCCTHLCTSTHAEYSFGKFKINFIQRYFTESVSLNSLQKCIQAFR